MAQLSGILGAATYLFHCSGVPGTGEPWFFASSRPVTQHQPRFASKYTLRRNQIRGRAFIDVPHLFACLRSSAFGFNSGAAHPRGDSGGRFRNCGSVVGVEKCAGLQRQTTAADAREKPSPARSSHLCADLNRSPSPRQPLPVRFGWRSLIGRPAKAARTQRIGLTRMKATRRSTFREICAAPPGCAWT